MKMKVLVVLALAAFLMVGSASATTYYVAAFCGSFSNPAPQAPITGSWVCPSAASLGITGSLTVASEFVDYSADFSNGLTGAETDVTNYTFNGAGFAVTADTLTSITGTSGKSNGPISTMGLPDNNSQVLPPFIPAGFYDNVTGAFGTITVNYSNTMTTGDAVQSTGYAEIVYDYNVTSAVPEPVTMLLFGAGLLGLSIVGRKKLARK